MPYSNPLIEFLKAYGPSEAANNLFDEHVQDAAERTGIAPFDVESDLLDDLEANFEAQQPANVILTGTAGDGKTYLCRKLYARFAPDGAADFREAGEVASFSLPHGKRLVVIKDLSELQQDQKDHQLEAIAAALLGETSDTVYLIAANDGQLLKFWRDYTEAHPDARQLFERLSWMLKEEREVDPEPDPAARLNVRLHNLSRQSNDELLERVLNAVIQHHGWKECEACPLETSGPTCPIRANRARLGIEQKTVFRERLKGAIAIAAANDMHLPMRQLFLLVANILLGDARSEMTGGPLLTCAKAQNRAQKNAYAQVNPYDNALGRNLRQTHRELYGAFTTLASLGIGQETNNAIDELLIERSPEELHDRVVADDPLYGATLLETTRIAYLRGDRDNIDALIDSLETQRRRLFFVLTADSREARMDPWSLTVFRSGGEYLAFQKRLRAGETPTGTIRQLVRGLNRTFTGTMAENNDQLWLAIPAGNVHDRTGRVLEHDPLPILRGRGGSAFFTVDAAGANRRPRLVIRCKADTVPRASIELRPLLFEYLSRVSEGSLPASFSRQCFEELKHFRLRAVAALNALDDTLPTEDDLALVTLDEKDGRLESSPLGIEEME